MPSSGEEERQPLIAANDEWQERAAGGSPPAPHPSSSSTPAEVPTGAPPVSPPAPSTQAAAAVPTCRICLQDDEAGLERPCSCAGSMAWAHHDCIQRWIDEKHDATCEICKQQFRGGFREPPPRPPPAPLVAQLQVDNNDNRIVLLADPHTGAIVARVVVPPAGELGEEEAPAGGWRVVVPAEEAAETRGCSTTLCSVTLVALLLVCILGAFTIGSAADQGGSAGAATAGAWLVRIVLLSAWIGLRTMHPIHYRRRQAAVAAAAAEEEARHWRHTDLESGLQQRQR